jgi:hypothetical protein
MSPCAAGRIVEQCEFYGKSMEYLDAMLISAGSDLSETGSFAMVAWNERAQARERAREGFMRL